MAGCRISTFLEVSWAGRVTQRFGSDPSLIVGFLLFDLSLSHRPAHRALAGL
ncbi:MAG: hypothetical protein ACE5Q6_15275 [Dehalococcoidia bacterium]